MAKKRKKTDKAASPTEDIQTIREDNDLSGDTDSAGKGHKWKFWAARALACIVGGLAIVFANPTFDVWPLLWIAFIPLFFAVEGISARRGFWWGWLFGASIYHGGYYYLVYTINVFGGFPIWLSLILYSALCFACGIQFGFFVYLFKRIEEFTSLSRFLIIPSLLVTLEFLYPLLFPWTLGSGMYRVLIIGQVADLFGTYAISFLIIFFNLLAYEIWRARSNGRALPVKPAALFGCMLVAVIVYGAVRQHQIEQRMSEAPELSVALVQANIDIFEKRQGHNKVSIHRLHNELAYRAANQLGEQPDLVVWPESSFRCWIKIGEDGTYSITRCPTETEDLIPELDQSWLVFGGLGYKQHFGEVTGKYNSAFVLNDKKELIGNTNKKYLLAFGEYMPFSDTFPFLKDISQNSGDFTPARESHLLEGPKGSKLAVIICYEDIIPEFTRRLAARGANLLVNITNDAWFGKSNEPYQHLALSVFRAIENRLYLVRTVNSGVTAIISPTGQILDATKIFTATSLPGKVALMTGRTVYSYIGDLFAWVNAAVFIAFAVLAIVRWRRRRQTAQ